MFDSITTHSEMDNIEPLIPPTQVRFRYKKFEK
jgi:hypothetical protein